MRLAFKLTLLIMVTMAILLAVHSMLVIDREVTLFEEDMERHANLVGNIISASLPDILQNSNVDRLEEFIQNVNKSESKLQVRLVDLNSRPDSFKSPQLSQDDLSPLYAGSRVLKKGIGANGDEALFAYFPIESRLHHAMAIEVSESLTPMKDYISNTIYRKVILFLAIVFFGGILVLWVGARMVGKPVSEMAELANRVSIGDFTGSVPIHDKRDELAHLAFGLNEMVSKLDMSRRRLQEETAKKVETIEQLHHAERLATVGKLASGLAHELGTPLNVVSGRARMVTMGDLNDEEINECANIINEQSERMTKILRQLLDFARRRTPERTTIDVFEPINRTVSLLKPTASAKKIRLIVNQSVRLPAIKADAGQLQQVLSNLIINAIHAMPDGGEIVLTAERREAVPPADIHSPKGKFICIEVRDQGMGIPEDDIKRIFTPFFSTKGVGEGTGLGLSISHGIISEHRGWIEVTSKLGKGSLFSIYLPME